MLALQLSLVMRISEITSYLERLAPLAYQENYDNAGLITGSPEMTCTGVLISLDATEDIVLEAIEKGCNLVVSHHPIVFSGIKKLTGKNYVEKAVIGAVKNDIALYAIHTNLDNVKWGVNGRIAKKLGLSNSRILEPRKGALRKLVTFVPETHLETVREALFLAGAGEIGPYSECSYAVRGEGTFKAGIDATPFLGETGKRHSEGEYRLELIYPSVIEAGLLHALKASHPYEEIAYDLFPLTNAHPELGAGMVGELPYEMDQPAFLEMLKQVFQVAVIRHTRMLDKSIRTVAICGGAGSFLISNALAVKADAFITADLKYHEFFDANGQILLADPGHYETEQYSMDLLHDILAEKFPTFAVFKTGLLTNPVNYYT